MTADPPAALEQALEQSHDVKAKVEACAEDLALREVANRLSQHARDEDTVCRSGGDEFLYLLLNPKSRADVERKAMAVLGDIAQAIEVGGVASSSAPASGLPCIRVTARRSTSSCGTPTRRCTAPRTADVAMSCSAPPGTAFAPESVRIRRREHIQFLPSHLWSTGGQNGSAGKESDTAAAHALTGVPSP